MKFGILQKCTVTGCEHWVQPGAFMAASSGFGPGSLAYDSFADAERDVEKLKAENERDVQQTKRSRKFKKHPATYTVCTVVNLK
jgi:hypothetical protein